jgi:hypothetical protein
MILLIFSDYFSRHWLPVGEPWIEEQQRRTDVLR